MLTIHERKVCTLDQMDASMDMLRAVWLAVMNEDWRNGEGLAAAAATLEKAIAGLEPVREALNSEHTGAAK